MIGVTGNMFASFLRLLRYDWPLHFVLLLTNWLPDSVLFLRLRGYLARHFIGYCDGDLRLGRNIQIYNPMNLKFGKHVYVAFGCVFICTSEIVVEDEVIFGPYCVLASGNHTLQNCSFRYGETDLKPIKVESGCWIASHVVLTAGSNVGKGSLVAAGAVVNSTLRPAYLSGGIPAKEIKLLETKE